MTATSELLQGATAPTAATPDALLALSDSHPIVLFDGVCRLCNGSVSWLIDRDRRARLRFGALQWPSVEALLATFETAPEAGVDAAAERAIDPLQSEDARGPAPHARASHQLPEGRARVPAQPDTFILVDRRRVYARSTAALRTLRAVGGVWACLYPAIIIPRVLRDLVYRLVARNRYKWFGKHDVCRVPTPALAMRFIPIGE